MELFWNSKVFVFADFPMENRLGKVVVKQSILLWQFELITFIRDYIFKLPKFYFGVKPSSTDISGDNLQMWRKYLYLREIFVIVLKILLSMRLTVPLSKVERKVSVWCRCIFSDNIGNIYIKANLSI